METAVAFLSLAGTVTLGILGWRLSRRLAAIEEDRRRDERSPRLVVEWEFWDGSEPAVRIINMGPQRLDRLEWAFDLNLADHSLAGLGNPPATAGVIEGLDIGGECVLLAELDAANGASDGNVVLRLRAIADRDEWLVPARVLAQWPPRPPRVW